MGEWDRLRSEFVRGEWFDFLHPHGFAESTPMLEEFIKTHGLDGAHLRDPLTAIRRLSATLYEALGYDKSVTDADSPIDHALEAGRGVCQDFAHIMIAVCRAWGVPARYVSGYLYTDRAHTMDRSDPDSTHAWVEVFLPSLRWVGFDPTNNVVAGERHVVAAVGATMATCRPRAGSTRATPIRPWWWRSRCATPARPWPSRSSCACRARLLQRRPPPGGGRGLRPAASAAATTTAAAVATVATP